MDRLTRTFQVGPSPGVTAIVDGFFAAMWFGWGQAEAPSWLVVPLLVGVGLGVLTLVLGVVMTARTTGWLDALTEPDLRRRYNVVVGTEFGLIVVGAILLGLVGLAAWVAVWVCLVVGLHFIPLATVLQNPSLRPLGALVVCVAVVALVVGLATTAAPSTITGVGAGLCLLVFGIATLLVGASEQRLAKVERGRS